MNRQILFQCKHGYNSLIGGAVERPNLQIPSRLGKTENLSWAQKSDSPIFAWSHNTTFIYCDPIISQVRVYTIFKIYQKLLMIEKQLLMYVIICYDNNRHRVYDYQVYPVGMSDMRLIDNRVSTTWCQVCHRIYARQNFVRLDMKMLQMLNSTF